MKKKKNSVGCRGQIIRESCTCCTFSMYSHDNRVSDNINTLINTYVKKKKQNKKTQKSSLCLCCSKSLCCTLYGGEGGREGEKENAKENN